MSVAVLVSASEALDVAQEVANTWSETAADRDIDGQSPTSELRVLSESGLLGITIPQSHGGAAIGPRDLAEVFRILARADLSLAQTVQNHFDFVEVLGSAIPQTRDYLYQEVLHGKRFGNALAEFGGDGERTLLAQLVVRVVSS
ncbi:acyl-CoA dehydrogenase family protein [Gordonia sp. NB41Y]|uniref:acyl-CoA dehydrogenase family protein n=1 Tax=Gordonia sp. NB41Y TaxID=875808 RepID=UPI0006B1A509|nr:acyl-CoA dehydrogenase family protein [Gordonia sp. NB41Y]WLP88426.1 acyl-CoA dehydrogenase family protein [Gordonia sp. NB41Y]